MKTKMRTLIILSVLFLFSMAAKAAETPSGTENADVVLARLEAMIPDKPQVATPEVLALMQQAGETKRLDAAMLLIRGLAFNWHPHVRNESKSLLEMFPAAVMLIHEYGAQVLPLLMYAGVTTEHEWLQKRIVLVMRELGGEQEIRKMRTVFSIDTTSNPSGKRIGALLETRDLKIELADPLRDQLEELERLKPPR